MSRIIKDITTVVYALKQGNVAAIPTETVYGLAANAKNSLAVKKIFDIKQRPASHPLILHIKEGEDITPWVLTIPAYAKKLMQKFWPGPLTLVFHAQDNPETKRSRGGLSTIAIRCPKHTLTQTLLKALPFPLVAPSANPFGKISPTTAEHVLTSFKDESFFILDGGRCHVGIESTIVSALDPKTPMLLREGMLTRQMLSIDTPMPILEDKSVPLVPGRLKTHYQPEKPLFCFKSHMALELFLKNHENTSILSFEPICHPNAQHAILPQDPTTLAYELYYQLRLADAASTDCIAMVLPPQNDATRGILERLMKAKTPLP